MTEIMTTTEALIEHSVTYEDMKLSDSIDAVKSAFYDLVDEDGDPMPWAEVSELLSFYSAVRVSTGIGDEFGEASENLIKSKFNYKKIVKSNLWVLFVLVIFFVDWRYLMHVSGIFMMILFLINFFYKRSKIVRMPKSRLSEIGNWNFFVTGKASSHIFYESKYDSQREIEQEALSLLNLAEVLDEDPIEVETYSYVSEIYTLELQIGEDFKLIYAADDLPDMISVGKMNWLQRIVFDSSFVNQAFFFWVGAAIVTLIG